MKFITKIKDDNNCTELINTNELQCWISQESIFDKTQPVIKSRRILGQNIDIQTVVKLLNDTRTDWDKNIEIHEEVFKVSQEISIIHSALKSPNVFISARDFIEKRIQFLDQGVYYSYSSSVPDSVLPQIKKYCRCITIFSITILCLEKNELVF